MPNWQQPEKQLGSSAVAESVRRRLRALRLARGMSQAELARRTNMATSSVSRLESGERGLTVDHLAPLAAVLGVRVGELFGSTARSDAGKPRTSDPKDLDLRRIRYFVTLAKELHFGQAADCLFITQPMLSRQISKLEKDFGVDLLTRSSRRVQLTAAGRQLLEDAQPLLATAAATQRRVQRAATGRAGLTVGFLVGDPIIQLVRAFDSKHPDTDIAVERIYWSDQPRALLEDDIDVSFVHRPIGDDGLDGAYLYSLPMVALLPSTHRLAARSELSVRDVARDPVVQHWGANAVWETWRDLGPRRDGRRPRRGPTVRSVEDD